MGCGVGQGILKSLFFSKIHLAYCCSHSLPLSLVHLYGLFLGSERNLIPPPYFSSTFNATYVFCQLKFQSLATQVRKQLNLSRTKGEPIMGFNVSTSTLLTRYLEVCFMQVVLHIWYIFFILKYIADRMSIIRISMKCLLLADEIIVKDEFFGKHKAVLFYFRKASMACISIFSACCHYVLPIPFEPSKL